MNDALVCGVDAGGTKTEALLATAGGAVLARVVGGAARLGEDDRATGTIAALVTSACTRAGVDPACLQALVAGVSGVDGVAAEQRAARELGALLPGVPVMVRNDAVVALAAAADERPAGVLIAGTGAIAYGERADGSSVRVGGWGHVLGDEGSGFDLGMHGVRAALQSFDGRRRPTSLTQRAIAHFGVAGPAELVGMCERSAADPQLLASFAPVVCATARDGDALARTVLANASERLAAQAIALMRRIGAPEGCALAFAGGLLTNAGDYAAAVASRVAVAAPNVRIVSLDMPAASGAAFAALVRLGLVGDVLAARSRLSAAVQGAEIASVASAGR